jgi:8-oxo-dGTP pyrophosphatase MutT (NUDIX family)
MGCKLHQALKLMKIKPIKSVFVVAFDRSKILMVKAGEKSGQTTGIFGLPAGKLDKGESYIQAAKREFNEETGLSTDLKYLTRLPGFYTAELERKDGLRKFCAWSYYCSKYTGKLKGSEEDEPQWIDINEVSKLHLQINVDKVIQEALKFRNNDLKINTPEN